MSAFTAALLEAGAEPATARSRQLSCKRFAAWLHAEGELDTNPLLGLQPPKLDTKVTDALTGDELKALIKACAGKDLRERRDEAIVRLMAETGMRAGEVIALQTADIDLTRGLATVPARQGRQGPHRAVRAADRHRHRPLHPRCRGGRGSPGRTATSAPAVVICAPTARSCGSVIAARDSPMTACMWRCVIAPRSPVSTDSIHTC